MPTTRLTPKILAWAVHLYTAMGLLAAGGIAVALLQPSPGSFRAAFFLMLTATLIDATDGTFARWAQVKKVLPGFDGARLDDIIDFQTYTTLPLLVILRAGLLPAGHEGWLILPLLASAYGFCQSNAKTPDGYFLGFPSYWNVIAFYLYVLQPPGWVAVGILILFALLTFVPLRYLYPSQGGWLNYLTLALSAVWCVLLLWILWRLPEQPTEGRNADTFALLLALLSLGFPLYYLAASWFINLKAAVQRRMAKAATTG